MTKVCVWFPDVNEVTILMFTGGRKGDCDVVGGNACWRQASQRGDDRRPMTGIFGIAGNGGICAGFWDIEVMSGS